MTKLSTLRYAMTSVFQAIKAYRTRTLNAKYGITIKSEGTFIYYRITQKEQFMLLHFTLFDYE